MKTFEVQQRLGYKWIAIAQGVFKDFHRANEELKEFPVALEDLRIQPIADGVELKKIAKCACGGPLFADKNGVTCYCCGESMK